MGNKTILTEVDGWTPMIDKLIIEHGYMTSMIFGIIWRYCQMIDGVCTASKETLAKKLGVSRQTIITHANWLVKNGYLTVFNKEGEPSTYRDTGKAGVSIRITGGVKEIDRGCKPSLQGGVKQVDTNKTLIREVNHSKKNDKAPTMPKPELDKYVDVLAEVCVMDKKLRYGRIAKTGKELWEAGYTPVQIKDIYSTGGKWYREEWRGKKGDRPTLAAIGDTIMGLLNSHAPGAYKAQDPALIEAGRAQLEKARKEQG